MRLLLLVAGAMAFAQAYGIALGGFSLRWVLLPGAILTLLALQLWLNLSVLKRSPDEVSQAYRRKVTAARVALLAGFIAAGACILFSGWPASVLVFAWVAFSAGGVLVAYYVLSRRSS